MIILLNGASSSGKTSLARELQQRWNSPLLLFGIDDVISLLPFKFTGEGEQAALGFQLRQDTDVTGIVPGESGYRLNSLAAEYTAKLSASGFDIVIDYVFIDEQLLEPFIDAYTSIPVLFCGVYCDLEELNRREGERGDRFLGLAESQAKSVHFCRDQYDLELDSTAMNSEGLADLVEGHIKNSDIGTGIN